MKRVNPLIAMGLIAVGSVAFAHVDTAHDPARTQHE
jgi:hypothetical protein